jgi:HEAT repeat protein
MIRRLSTLLYVLIWSLLLPVASGEEVEVIVDTVPIKVEDTILASAKSGDRLQVIRRSGPWVAVSWRANDTVYRGWVFATQVRTVADPGITEDSPAPPAFDPIKVSIRETQFLWRRSHIIYLTLTIINDGHETIAYDATQVTLTADGNELRCLPRNEACTTDAPYASLFTTATDGTLSPTSISQVQYLETGQLGPASQVSAWVAFAIPEGTMRVLQAPQPDAPSEWRLSIPLGQHLASLDLRAVESAALSAKIHPSVYDASVPVLEIGSRVNLLNVDRLSRELEQLFASGQGFVISVIGPSCLFDAYGGMAIGRILRSRVAMRGIRPVVCSVGTGRDMGPLATFPLSGSEATAVLEVLGQRPGGGDILRQGLSDAAADIRLTAARCLTDHLDDPRSVAALAQATRDGDPVIRFAALRSLSAGLGGLPRNWSSETVPIAMAPLATPLRLEGDLLEVMLAAAEDADANVRGLAIAELRRSQDQRATRAITKALKDPVQSVYTNAIRSAGKHAPDLVVSPLLEHLASNRGTSAQETVCGVLGQLKSEAAVPALQELQGGRDTTVAAAAVGALAEIGAMSALDAALQKMENPYQLSPQDWHVLAQSKDPRAIAKLLDALGHQSNSVVANAAEALGKMREASAVEPLIRVVQSNDQYLPGEVSLALGEIGDKRAIAPLEKALARQPNAPAEIIVALAMLQGPDARSKAIDAIRNDQYGSEVSASALMLKVSRLFGDKNNQLLVTLLDQPERARYLAAKLLLEQGTPGAKEQLFRRLSAADYPWAADIILRLAGTYGYEPRAWEDWEECRPQLQSVVGLLDRLVSADNPTTQNAANEALQRIERAIGAAGLQTLRHTPKD